MKTLLLTATYLVGFGELFLAGYFWKTNSKNEIRRVMALLAFSTGMWVLLSAATSYVEQTPLTSIYVKFLFIFGILLLTILFHLILVFPHRLFRMDEVHVILLYIPVAIFSLISLTSTAIVDGFIGSPTVSGYIIPGPIYNVYNIYLFILYLTSLIILLHRVGQSDGIEKNKLTIVFWSILVGGLPAIVIDLIIPFFGSKLGPNALYANLATVVWLGATTYVVRRKTL